jgi:hypothetical protein
VELSTSTYRARALSEDISLLHSAGWSPLELSNHNDQFCTDCSILNRLLLVNKWKTVSEDRADVVSKGLSRRAGIEAGRYAMEHDVRNDDPEWHPRPNSIDGPSTPTRVEGGGSGGPIRIRPVKDKSHD